MPDRINNIKLSVIIPARNEDTRIESTLVNTAKYLDKQDYAWEILVIDNSSTDKTGEKVEKLAEGKVKNLRLVETNDNRGKGAAVQRGVFEANGEYVMFMDADNATPISEIEKFWPYLEKGIEVVIGDRYMDEKKKAKQPWYRTILSRGSNLLIQIVLGHHFNDTQAGFKAFNAEAAKKMFKKQTIFGWAFDMELFAIALKFRYRIQAVPIIRDQTGGSSVPATAFIQSLRDLFIIKWRSLTGRYSAND
jgi:dolichyl-phosphate beta-glucosyltransferase